MNLFWTRGRDDADELEAEGLGWEGREGRGAGEVIGRKGQCVKNHHFG